MKKNLNRAEKAAKSLSKAIIEMGDLMYQNTTALKFFTKLIKELDKELSKRINEK